MQIFHGDLLDLLRGDGAQAGNDVENAAPVPERRVLPELQGAVEQRVLGVRELRLHQILGAFQFFGRDRRRLELLDLAFQRAFGVPPRSSRGHAHGQREQFRVERRAVVAGVRAQGEALFFDQTALQTRAAPAAQQHRGQRQREAVVVREIGHVVAGDVDRQGRRAFEMHAAFAALGRLARRDGRHRRPRGEGAEVGADVRQQRIRVHGTGDHQGDVAGRVIRLPVGFHVLQPHGLQIVHPAHDRPAVGVGGERRGADLFPQVRGRFVRGALPALFHHDLPLGQKVFFGQQRMRHAVGFEFQKQVEMLHRGALEIHRVVGRRERVVPSAAFLDEARELALAVSRRAAEHQMLQQMRNARQARPFVARADAIPDLQRGDRGAVVFQDEDRQPVVEDVFRNLPAVRRFVRGFRADGAGNRAEDAREGERAKKTSHAGAFVEGALELPSPAADMVTNVGPTGKAGRSRPVALSALWCLRSSRPRAHAAG